MCGRTPESDRLPDSLEWRHGLNQEHHFSSPKLRGSRRGGASCSLERVAMKHRYTAEIETHFLNRSPLEVRKNTFIDMGLRPTWDLSPVAYISGFSFPSLSNGQFSPYFTDLLPDPEPSLEPAPSTRSPCAFFRCDCASVCCWSPTSFSSLSLWGIFGLLSASFLPSALP